MGYRIASLAAVAVLVVGGTAACGKADETSLTPTLTGIEGMAPAATPPPHTAAKTGGPSELQKGQKITATTEDGPAEITLLAVHRTTSIGTAKPDAGTQWVIYSMQVKNLGTSGE